LQIECSENKKKQRAIYEITFKIFKTRIISNSMNLPKLFVKQGCPWCIDALDYFKKIGLELEVIDVRIEPEKMSDLVACSGQSKTPTLKNGDFVVADFDTDEFKQAMLDHPSEATKLGIKLK
jgi:monothiol glutaredoxin